MSATSPPDIFLISSGNSIFIRTFLGSQPTTHQQLFLVSLAFEILLFPTIYFLRRRERRWETPAGSIDGDSTPSGQRCGHDPVSFDDCSVNRPFSRLLVFFLLIGFLKAIFLQMDYVFPKFGDRELGLACACRQTRRHQCDRDYLPRAGGRRAHAEICRLPHGHHRRRHLCRRSFHHGVAARTGSMPAANSAIGQWLGHSYLGLQGSIHPYYVMSALYLIVFSIGEAFYSPRVYEYAAAIAPTGQEASYGALAYLPFLVGKLLVGTSGWILAAFCPAEGPRRSGMMWLIFALAASSRRSGCLFFAVTSGFPKPDGTIKKCNKSEIVLKEVLSGHHSGCLRVQSGELDLPPVNAMAVAAVEEK